MAVKDISPTTIANILVLIASANSFAMAYAKSRKSYLEIPSQISKSITPNPNGASAELKSWYEKYIKNGAPAAGIATITSTTSLTDWTSNFFTVRTDLLPNVSPEVIAALDAWWIKYTTYKIKGEGKW